MSNKDTLVVGLIGGPCVGKSTIAAEVFAQLKKMGVSVEHVPEYAKTLVWMQKWDELNNQWLVSYRQANLIRSMLGKVDVIVTDAPVILGLYYNRHNPDNTSNPDKVEQFIDTFQKEHNTNRLDVLLDRSPSTYDKFDMNGRIHGLTESLAIDKFFKDYLDRKGNYYLYIPDSHDSNVTTVIVEQVMRRLKRNIYDHPLEEEDNLPSPRAK